MKKYRADLHIHTILSPCADLNMTPDNIIAKAQVMGLNIIGITDHNSTKHAWLVKEFAEKKGIYTLTGAEVTTKEEVHCLVFFEKKEQLKKFQKIIDENISIVPNPDGYFGYQPVIDKYENIIEMIPNYLPAALSIGINRIQEIVYEMEGIFIPAHIDRPVNGLLNQLGFIPSNLKYDALGLSKYGKKEKIKKQYKIGENVTFIRNSDAHFIEQIGEIYTVFFMEKLNFSEIKMALNLIKQRFCKII